MGATRLLEQLRGFLRARPVLYRLLPPTAHIAHSQSNEAQILAKLVAQLDAPRSFLEFGFSPSELNCALLLDNCRGLLVDGDIKNVRVARRVMPPGIEAMHVHLTLANLHVLTSRYRAGELGVLSIDVDGNDYWFLEALLPQLAPAIVAVEYNASFLLRPITVPYDPKFDRHEKHPSGLYHGASLEALTRLCAGHRYRLVEISSSGVNAFYVRDEHGELPTLDASAAYRESVLRNQLSGTTAAEQWESIKDLEYVAVG